MDISTLMQKYNQEKTELPTKKIYTPPSVFDLKRKDILGTIGAGSDLGEIVPPGTPS
jgi:hypothetical protein